MLNVTQAGVICPILSGIVRGYSQNDLVGGALFPGVPVTVAGGQILTFGKEAMKQYDTRRSPGSDIQTFDVGFGSQKYALTNHKLAAKLPIEIAKQAETVPHVDLATISVVTTFAIMTLELEREQAALARTSANYGANNKMALTGSQKWTDPNSNPKADVAAARAAVRKATGKNVTVAVIGPDVLSALEVHPVIQDHFKYTANGSITLDMLARYLNVPKLVVGNAITATDNDADPFTDVWGGDMILAFTEFGSQSNAQPTFGYTYTMEGNPAVRMPWFNKGNESWIYPVGFERAPVVSWKDAGFLIQGCA